MRAGRGCQRGACVLMLRVAWCAAAAAASLETAVDGDARAPASPAAGGTWYVYQPQLKYASAGGRAMHHLAGALSRTGARVRMAHANPKFARLLAGTECVNMSSSDVAALWEHGLGPSDTLVAAEVSPEFAPIEVDGHVPHSQGISDARDVSRNIAAMEKRGGVVARWMLGASEDWGDRVSERVSVHVGASHYLHGSFAGSGPHPLHVPFWEPELIERARAWQKGDPSTRANARREAGRRIVVFDDDVDAFDAGELQRALDRAAPSTFWAVRFSGFSRADAFALMESASVFIDLHLPGLESGVCEFAAFGASVILTAFGHGESAEYPDTFPRLVDHSPDAVAKAVVDASVDQAETFAYGNWCFELDARFEKGVEALKASRETHFATYARSGPDFASLAPLAVSLFCRHAFSSLTVVVESGFARDRFWERLGPAAKESLRRLGLAKRVRVAACEACPDLAEAVLDHARSAADVAVLVRPGSLAPSAFDLESAAAERGCAVTRSFAVCASGSTETSRDVAATLRAEPPETSDCDDLKRHAIWRGVEPSFQAASRDAARAACAID